MTDSGSFLNDIPEKVLDIVILFPKKYGRNNA